MDLFPVLKPYNLFGLGEGTHYTPAVGGHWALTGPRAPRRGAHMMPHLSISYSFLDITIPLNIRIRQWIFPSVVCHINLYGVWR